MVTVTTTRAKLDSPLRYPGGKSSLSGFLADCVAAMQREDVTYVEPYAGGAGAGISLLLAGTVERIVINDLDPAVHSFWRCVLEDAVELCSWIQEVPLDLPEWNRQRDIYQAARRDDWKALGRAFFYLNRTNRSGVLNAGVIGGRAQTGDYKIGARFNRDQLAARIHALAARSDHIDLRSVDGRKLIEELADVSNVFVYADPPYVKMGRSLYLNAFDELDHTLLATCLARHQESWWFLTYDDSALVRRLYAEMTVGEYSLHWSARNQGMAKELYVMSRPLAAALGTEA